MRRHIRIFGHSVGTTTLFALAVGGGALLHLDVPLARKILISRVNAALAPVLAGKITIERVESVKTTGVTSVDVRVEDPKGRRVLHLQGVRARVATMDLVRSLFGGGDIDVGVSELSIENADVNLDADEAGGLQIAKSFVPRKTLETAPVEGRGVHLQIPSARLAHATVHGNPGGGQSIDADVDNVEVSLLLASGKFEMQVPHAAIVARGVAGGLTASGSIADASFAQPSPNGGDRRADVSWRGTVGGVAESVRATYDGGLVDAALDVPEAKPEDVRALWPASPLTETSAAHVAAHGTLPNVFVLAQLSTGKGTLSVAGPLALEDSPRAVLRFQARDIDARAFAPGPATELGASGELLFAMGRKGAMGAALLLDAGAGRVGAIATPPVSLVADLQKNATRTEGEASILVQEAGAPTDIKLHLGPEGGASSVLSFDATTRLPALDRVARVGPVARGRAQVSAQGRIDLVAHTVDGKLAASAADVGVGIAHIGSANVRARVNGPISAPIIDADAHARQLLVGGVPLASLDATAHGTPMRSSVKLALVGQDGRLDADALLDLTDGATIRNVAVVLDGRGEHVTAEASLVSVGSAGTRADDILIEGLGAPLRASFATSPNAVMVKAHTRGLELVRLAHAGGIARQIGGRISLDVDAALRWNGAEGRVALDVTDATIDGWEGAKAHVEASILGRRITGRATASLGDIASIDVQTKNAEIGGAGPLEPGWWRRTWGEVDLTGKVDLAKLEAKLPPAPGEDGSKKISKRISGVLDLKAQLERDSATDDTPLVDFQASTKNLVLSGPGEAPRWRLEGVDASVDVKVDGETGHTAIDAQLSDAIGLLADFNLSSDRVPYGRLFGTSDDLLALAQVVPFTANFTVPERDVRTLPAIAGMRGMEGRIKAALEWDGSLLRPKVDATASLSHARTDVRVFAMPLDVALGAQYDGARAHLTLGAQAHARPVLEAEADVDARASDLVAAADGAPLAWKASGKAKLESFPLQSIGVLDDHQVRGLASGQMSLDGLNDDAKASLALKFDDLHVGDVVCKSAEAQVSVDGSALSASIGIDQSDGSVELRAQTGSHWGSAMAPSVDATQAADVSLVAKHFRAELLQPFLSSVFAQLDGRIDADAKLSINPATRSVRPQGTIALKDGTFEMASVGGEFHDVAGKMVLTPDGLVRLENVVLHGLSGRIQAAATARLEGLSLAAARAEVQIPKNDPLPLVLDGVQAGTLDGRLGLSVDRTPDRSGLEVAVDLPTLHVQLPTSSAHDVQTLGTLDGVQVGVKRGGEFVATQLDGDGSVPDKHAPSTPMKIAVKLGRDVEVMRGSDLDVHLTGAPTILVADETRVSGQVHIESQGTIDVDGKTFQIENGTITFVGDDASNPQVSLTALWQASDPENTRIFADFVGPLKTAKVTLRSEPSRSPTEIRSLILFGTVDEQAQGAGGVGGTGQSNTAAAAAGGAATGPLNKALGGINKALDNFGLAGGLVTKIDTSQAAARPEVELQIARDISVQVAWVIGLPPPGSNPDSTLFTLNWRFLRKWQLETTVGDAGTTIMDLVWQHRY